MVDPHIDYSATPPTFWCGDGEQDLPTILPGTRLGGTFLRFRWPDVSDPDVARLRNDFPGGGRGLYVLYGPLDSTKFLVEAYSFANGLQPRYWESSLEPVRRHDANLGHLVVVGNDLGGKGRPMAWRGDADPRMFRTVRRRHFRPKYYTPEYARQEVDNLYEMQEERALEEMSDLYYEGMKDINYHGLPKAAVAKQIS